MKNVKMFVKILTLIGSLAAVVFFFFPFAKIQLADGQVILTGSQICFGGSHSYAGETVTNAISAYFTLTFILMAIGAVLAAFALKFKGAVIASPIFTLIAAILMLTFLGGTPHQHVDARPFSIEGGNFAFQTVSYEVFFYVCLYVMLAALVIAAATVFILDFIEVKESNGEKKTMIKRFVRWLLDYKSELKKIVWPTKNEVTKNTIIVLIMCAVIGGIVWLLDYGLGALLTLVINSSAG